MSRAGDHAPSVVGGGIELGKEHAGEAEAGEIADAHRKERTDEVIALVLDDARVEALGLALERPALDVDAAIADARETRHHATQARHREAPFPAFLDRVADRLDDRVEKHGLGDRRRLGVAIVAGEAEDDALRDVIRSHHGFHVS